MRRLGAALGGAGRAAALAVLALALATGIAGGETIPLVGWRAWRGLLGTEPR